VVVNPATETRPIPEYDLLEVNHYLMSGLVVSSIDKWFMGPIPKFSPEDLGVPGDKQDLQSAIKRAQAVASDPVQIAWQTVGIFRGRDKTQVLMRLGIEHNSERFISSRQKSRCTRSRTSNALSKGIRQGGERLGSFCYC
jgi:hypothetical protein